MAYAMFHCCVTARHLPDYDPAADALLSRLGVGTVEIREFGCCGYPLKNVDFLASLTASARNLALAEREGRPILTTCVCCYGTLRQAALQLRDDRDLLARVNQNLATEGLSYHGGADVRHLLHVLKNEVGLDRISRQAAANPAYPNVVLQYGCKLQRPRLSAESGGARLETFFEELVAAAGAKTYPWGLEKECCGSGITTTDPELARTVGRNKMDAAKSSGADGLVAACPFCLLQLRRAGADGDGVPVLSIAQWLGAALGLEGPG